MADTTLEVDPHTMQPTTDHRTLLFAFLGVERNWEHVLGLPEAEQPSGRVFVYRALPGNQYAWGHTREEAVQRLQVAIEFAMSQAESPDAWYREAAYSLKPEDEAELQKTVAETYRDGNVHLRELLLTTCKLVVFEKAPTYSGRPSAACGVAKQPA